MSRLDDIAAADSTMDAVRAAQGVLHKAGVENWMHEAVWLTCHAFSLSQAELYTVPVTQQKLASLKELVDRRAAREPLQYVLGRQEFMGREYIVGEGVLIPRLDTQSLVEITVELIGERNLKATSIDLVAQNCREFCCDSKAKNAGVTGATARLFAKEARQKARQRCVTEVNRGGLRVLDLCTGSGCVAISVKLACPNCDITASDVSETALAFARENGKRLGAEVRWLHSDMFANIPGAYDVITCNPPYIADNERLQPELAFEPREALMGGHDGLDFYRILRAKLRNHLYHGGFAVLECGDNQAARVCEILDDYVTQVHSDMFGHPRIILVRN